MIPAPVIVGEVGSIAHGLGGDGMNAENQQVAPTNPLVALRREAESICCGSDVERIPGAADFLASLDEIENQGGMRDALDPAKAQVRGGAS